MVHTGYAMWNAVSNSQNFQLKSNNNNNNNNTNCEMLCHCSVPVFSTSRRDPLATSQVLCGNHQKMNVKKCHFSFTLNPINFLDTVPALFVYEIQETGELFKSFHTHPVKAVMEFLGLIPTIYKRIRIDALFVDEVSMQDCREYLHKVEYFDLLVLFLTTINEIARDDGYLASSWSEKIDRYFPCACETLNEHEQLVECTKHYYRAFIKSTLLDLIQCQV